MKVSFILPIYNVEKYLGECIESLLVQSYTNFEVILVDDGSPDGCPALCDEWAKKDARIKVLHKPNGGLSDARNAGLEIAQGDYVIFVDSDDFWVDKNGLQNLMEVVKENPECDFISFNCSYYYQDTKTYKKWIPYDEKLAHPIDKDTAMRSLVASGTMPMSACLKVISRKFLSDMGLSFIKGQISEDIPWFIDLMEGSKKCMFVNHYIYAYRQNVIDSISSKVTERSFASLLNIVEQEVKKLEHRTFSPEAKDALCSFIAYEFCILLAMLGGLPSSIRLSYRNHLYSYQWLFRYTQNPKVRKAAIVYRFCGIRVTEWILRFYLQKIR